MEKRTHLLPIWKKNSPRSNGRNYIFITWAPAQEPSL